MTMTIAHKSYMVKWGHNQYRIYSWSQYCKMYSESSASYPYHQARAIIGAENCRNPRTCTRQTHDHEGDL